MPRKFHRFKLLLDEGMPIRHYFPRLNSRFDVKHISSDLKLSGVSDANVYKKALSQGRLVVTYNTKDFVSFVEKSKNTGVIGISTNLSTEQIDLKLTSLLNKSTKGNLYGKFTYISGES